MTATLFTINGTGVTMWDGYPADVARALVPDTSWDGPYFELTGKRPPVPVWYWQPVGYPSAVFPMGPSVDAGVAELVRLLTDVHPTGPFAIVDYSQGSLIGCKVWRDYILNPDGSLHHRLPDFFAHITYGNPMRAPGVANGNVYAGLPMPKNVDGQVTGGISGPDDLTADQTPAWQLDFANDNDLYASCPVGSDPKHHETSVGKVETSIYNVVQKATLFDVLAIAGDLAAPIATVEAIINGLKFAAAGPNAGHWTYNIDAAVRYLSQRVAEVVDPVGPAPAPAVVTPTNGKSNVSSFLSILKKLPAIRKELVTGLTAAGSAIAAIHVVAPALPGNVQAIIAAASGVVATLTGFLKNNLVVTVIDDVGKL